MSSDAITPEPNPDPPASAIAPPPAPPRFPTQPYAPDGTASSLGVAAMLGGGLAAAVFVGFLAAIIGQWFYLVILFPCGIGAALGGVGIGLIKLGKIRNPLLAGTSAVLSGIMAMGTMHYVNYQRTLDEVTQQQGIERAKLEEGISFFRYLDLTAEEGVRLSSTHHLNDKGMNLGYVGSYIYWLVEILVVAGVAWAMMRGSASAPFCAACNAWKKDRPIASLNVPAVDMARQAIEDGEVVSLLACAGPVRPVGFLLKTAVCPHCGAEGEVDIALEQVTKNSKGQTQTKTLTRTTYPGEVLRFLSGEGA